VTDWLNHAAEVRSCLGRNWTETRPVANRSGSPKCFSKAVNCSFMSLSSCSVSVSIKKYLMKTARGSLFLSASEKSRKYHAKGLGSWCVVIPDLHKNNTWFDAWRVSRKSRKLSSFISRQVLRPTSHCMMFCVHTIQRLAMNGFKPPLHPYTFIACTDKFPLYLPWDLRSLGTLRSVVTEVSVNFLELPDPSIWDSSMSVYAGNFQSKFFLDPWRSDQYLFPQY